MCRPLLVFCFSFGLLLTSTPVMAQDEPAASEGAATGEFATLFAQWKDLLTRMREIQLEYKVVQPDERPALEKEFEELRNQGVALTLKLTAAAEAAYREDPTDGTEASQFMLSVLFDNLQRDGYEEAYRLAKLMIDNNYGNKAIYGAAGVAAFHINRLDEAEQYLNTADEAGKLETKAKELQLRMESQRANWEAEQAIRAKEDAAEGDEALPRVKLQTSKGDIVLELFENEAPNTVANFVSLVEKEFYDGVPFHRVLEGFMAQGGDPTGTGGGGPGYTIECECDQENYRKHFRGSLSMAHAGPDTGGSQFFLTFVSTDFLDGKHTVFGRIIEGFDVLSKLQRRDPGSPNPPEPDKIVKATVVRKRNHEYVPQTTPE